MKKIALILSTIALFTISCKKKSVSRSTETKVEEILDVEEKIVIITFSTSGCYGTCPYYTADILENGTINFNGKAHTPVKGEHKFIGSREFVNNIKNSAFEMNFFEMQDAYDNKFVTDIPATTLQIQTNIRNKEVMNRFEGPKELGDLNDYINSYILNLAEKKKIKRKNRPTLKGGIRNDTQLSK